MQDHFRLWAFESVDAQRVVVWARGYIQLEPVITAFGKHVHFQSSPRGPMIQLTKGLEAQGLFGRYYLSYFRRQIG